MPLTNSADTYGRVTKTFHWLTALLILSNIALGWIASDVAHAVEGGADETLIARATLLFSIHKTLGVTIFFVALARILWALSQTKPGQPRLGGFGRNRALAALRLARAGA